MSWALNVALRFQFVFYVCLMLTAVPEINATLPEAAMEHQNSLPNLRLNGTIRLFFNPTSINGLERGCNRTVYFNCTYETDDRVTEGQDSHSDDNDAAAWRFNTSLYARIHSQSAKVAQIVILQDMVTGNRVDPYKPGPIFSTDFTFPIQLNAVQNFTIQAMRIGYVTVFVTIVSANSLVMAKSHLSQPVGKSEYKVSVSSRQKTADFAFDCSAAAVAILISFGIGCVTDTDNLKRQLKYPVSLVIGFCCQFLLMPVLAFGLAMILPLEKNVRFGLLCVACVPGGGLGHVAVIISDSDLPLSLTMNLISTVTMLGTAPLWIFVLGQYFQKTEGSKIIPIYNFEIWLASTFFAYTAGLVINRFKPGIADALLNWLIKPFLLLAAILYITLGVYINMYVFEVIEHVTVIAAILLPLCGFVVGSVLSIIFRQKTDFCQTVALETSSLNCLIVLAAIRFSLNQPDANLASVIPIWVMFTIPGMYVVLAILRMGKKSIDGFMENRKQKQYRHYSIASGIVNQANMAALSAPLFVTDTATEDDQASVSEKITVL